jgi:hypothetical protein
MAAHLNCVHCFHSAVGIVRGRERVGCLRARLLPDGKTLRPPRDGWEAVVERLPQSKLDWRAPNDACGPDAKHFKEGTND